MGPLGADVFLNVQQLLSTSSGRLGPREEPSSLGWECTPTASRGCLAYWSAARVSRQWGGAGIPCQEQLPGVSLWRAGPHTQRRLQGPGPKELRG